MVASANPIPAKSTAGLLGERTPPWPLRLAAPPCRSYDLQNARNAYRDRCGPEGLNRRLVQRYLEVSTLLLAPICP